MVIRHSGYLTAVWRWEQPSSHYRLSHDGFGGALLQPRVRLSTYFINAAFLYCTFCFSLCVFWGSVAVMCAVVFFLRLNLFYITCHSACQTRLPGRNFGWRSRLMTERRLRFTIGSSPLSNPGACVMVCFEWTGFAG